ncbi:MAG TPA: cytochrome P450 [Acidimicrobiales bacterium]|jgi:cytochrome P450
MTDRVTVDFDHHSREFHEERHERWAELRRCPVAHNPRYGGFWVVSGYDEVATVARDAETFSSRHLSEPDPDTDGIEYIGIAGVPRGGIPTAGIAEVEGVVHRALRRILNPFLVPAAIARMEPRMEATAAWFLDQGIETGAIDLVLDYANPVPAIFTMELIGLPPDNWHHYAELFHGMVAHRRGSPELRSAMANITAMLTELRDEVAARRDEPRDDLLTSLVELEVDEGRKLSDDELVSALWNLVGGGLDTTTSLTSLTLHYLDAHRDLRQRLVDQPELLDPATEEFLRYFSVNETLTRTVTRDVELGGQQLQRGDHLMLSWLSANWDEHAFDRPDQVVLDREPNPHLAFGVGPHRCIGLHMARTLFQVLIRQVLARIPDYEVDREATRFYQGNPELAGIVQMPARFTPGPIAGPSERPF